MHPGLPGQESAGTSHAHLLAGLGAFAAAEAAVDAGVMADVADAAPAFFTTTAGGFFAGCATTAGGTDADVTPTVSGWSEDAGFATPMTLPSESRRNAADPAGTIPMPSALVARLAGDFETSRDWLSAPWVSLS